MVVKTKTRDERVKIAVNLLKDLKQYQIPDSLPGIQQFHQVIRDYTVSEISSGLSGKIKVPEIGRTIEYNLPTRSTSEPIVRLIVS